jgi:hypothetical protein
VAGPALSPLPVLVYLDEDPLGHCGETDRLDVGHDPVTDRLLCHQARDAGLLPASKLLDLPQGEVEGSGLLLGGEPGRALEGEQDVAGFPVLQHHGLLPLWAEEGAGLAEQELGSICFRFMQLLLGRHLDSGDKVGTEIIS